MDVTLNTFIRLTNLKVEDFGALINGIKICPVCKKGQVRYIWSRVNGWELIKCSQGCIFYSSPPGNRCYADSVYEKPQIGNPASPKKFTRTVMSDKIASKATEISNMGNLAISKISKPKLKALI